MKKISFLMSVTILLNSFLTFTSFAAGNCDETKSAQGSEKLQIVEATQAFLDDYTGNTFLYESNDLESHMVSSQMHRQLPIEIDATKFTPYVSTREYLGRDTLTNQSTYILEKADYQKAMRLMQGIVRRNFDIDYNFHEVNVDGNYAQVYVTVAKTFYYEGETIQSYLAEEHEILLTKINDTWLIFDMTVDDGFDSTHKYTNFSAAEELAFFSDSYSNSATDFGASVTADDIPESKGSVASSRSYNRTNAVNYAYTYSKSGTSSFPSYYNSNFTNFSANCMNFVSQCFYAGFYGSNDTNAINSHTFPQDTQGNGIYGKWYTNSGGNDNYAWTAIRRFDSYMDYCSTDTGTRMTFSTANYASGVSTISTPASLVGAMVEVTGSGGNYSHVVLIDAESGDNRNQLYYTAHTTDAKHILFSDSYPTCPIKVVLPVSMVEVSNCTYSTHSFDVINASYGSDATCSNCNYCRLYIKNKLSNCVPLGNTVALQSGTNRTCFRIAMKVTAPNGTVTWMGEESCTNNYSKNYTFSQRGLYQITVYARDLNPDVYGGSIQISSTYTIRCY